MRSGKKPSRLGVERRNDGSGAGLPRTPVGEESGSEQNRSNTTTHGRSKGRYDRADLDRRFARAQRADEIDRDWTKTEHRKLMPRRGDRARDIESGHGSGSRRKSQSVKTNTNADAPLRAESPVFESGGPLTFGREKKRNTSGRKDNYWVCEGGRVRGAVIVDSDAKARRIYEGSTGAHLGFKRYEEAVQWMLDNNIWCDEGGGPLPVILDYVYPYRNEQSGAPYHPSLLPEESDVPNSDDEEARGVNCGTRTHECEHALALELTRSDASGSGKGTVPSPSNSARVIGDDRSGKHEQDLETLLGFFTIVADPRDGSRYMATLWHTMAKVFLQCEEWEHQGLTVSMREHETIEHAVTYLQLKGFTVPEPTRSTKTSYRGYAEPVLG